MDNGRAERPLGVVVRMSAGYAGMDDLPDVAALIRATTLAKRVRLWRKTRGRFSYFVTAEFCAART
jgi:hypothetical protein